MSDDFQIGVRRYDGPDGPRFNVWLPHQCDTWDIVGSEDGGHGRYEWATPQDEAVERLALFITEAQAALALLAAGEDRPTTTGLYLEDRS